MTHKNTTEALVPASVMLELNHELRTPIHSISSIIAHLEEGWDKFNDQQKQHHLIAISEASHRLVEILNHTLANVKISNKNSPTFSIFNLVLMLQSVVESCKRFYLYKTPFTIDFSYNDNYDINDDYRVVGEEFLLGRVITNLIANVVNHSHSDNVSISVRPTIEESSGRRNGYEILVKDQGKGFTPQQIDHINALLTQDNELHNIHSNFGLSMCGNIIRKYEGEGSNMSILNNPDGGATVRIYIKSSSSTN